LASRDLVLKVIGEAAEAYAADSSRVYLLGFSQGAIVAYTTALTDPRAVAGVVACGGRIPPEVEPWAVAPEETAGLPVCLLHGTGDTVLPIEWARKARTFLEARGVALTYREYDAPHTITPEMLADANTWLAERLAATPARRAAK
jgi:phospholipase/carboxylesterase